MSRAKDQPAVRGLRLLRLIPLCAVGALAACATMPAPQKPASPVTPAPPKVSHVNPARQEAIRLAKLPALAVPHKNDLPIDRSGRKETGRASFYAKRFAGHRMADGLRFRPNTNIAASKTLPIGTTAKVVNLTNGRSAIVTVNDRGPYVHSRMLDVSPKVATTLDMKHAGVAPVVVEPISVPLPNGTIRLGAGAATATPWTIRDAMRATRRVMAETGDELADR